MTLGSFVSQINHLEKPNHGIKSDGKKPPRLMPGVVRGVPRQPRIMLHSDVPTGSHYSLQDSETI